MNTITLKFHNLLELWQFLKDIGKGSSRINFDNSELTGNFTDAELHRAIHKMKAVVKE